MLTRRNKKPKVFFALFIALFTYVFWPLQVAASGGWLKNWNRRQQIIVEDENIDSDLSGFPVLIDLSTLSDSIFDYTKTNGEDLRMTTNDGVTEIPIEVVHLDQTANEGELWFYAATLSSTTNSEFYLYYDNPTANFYDRSHIYGSENVWSNGYVAVYHFQEEPVNGAYSLIDSSSSRNDLETYGNMSSANLVNGKFSKAVKFDGLNDMFQDSYNYVANSNISTVSIWANREGGTNDDILSLARSNSSGNSIYLDGSNQFFSIRRQNAGTGTNHTAMSGITTTASTWYYAASRFENSTYNLQILVDGILYGGTTVAAGTHGDSMIRVGADASNAAGGFPSSGSYFNGILDEARVAESYRSVDWISAEYTNQNTPASFYSNGTEEDNSFTIITGLVPEDDSTGIAHTDNLEITFDRNVTLLSGNLDIYETNVGLLKSVNAGSSEITGGGSSTLTIEPVGGLPQGRNLHVLIDNGFLQGPIAEQFYGISVADRWNFQTAPNPGDFNSTDWDHYNKITVLASQVNGDQTNFPVHLNLAHLPNEFFYNVRSDGRDIRMTESDMTTEIAFELVELDVNNGTGELWFKAPTLSGTIDTDFYIWYDNNSEVYSYTKLDTYGPANVWSQGYMAVFHMGQDPDGGDGSILDSTINNHHGNPINLSGEDPVASLLGSTLDLDGSTEYINVPSATTLQTTNGISYSAWIYPHDLPANNPVIDKWSLNTTDDRSFLLWTNSNTIRMTLGNGDGTAQTDLYSSGILTTNTWSYLTASWNGEEMRVFHNGDFEAATVKTDNKAINNAGMKIGSDYNVADRFNGLIDEVRIANEPRSDGWVDTEYANHSNGRVFYNIDNGSEDSLDFPLWNAYHKITILASEVSSDLEEFPVYVDLSDLPPNFFSTVRSDGGDIRITNSSNQNITFELVEINTSTQNGELWFKADFLSSTTDTDFFLRYGNPSATMPSETDGIGSQRVWSQNYVAVLHLGEDGNTSDNGYYDSTKFTNHGNGVSMTTSSDVNGQLGRAQTFDNTADYIQLANEENFDFADQSFTISAWVKTNDSGASNTILAKRGVMTGWLFSTNATGRVNALIKDGANFNDANSTATAVNNDNWQYVGGTLTTNTTVTNQEIDLFISGAEDTGPIASSFTYGPNNNQVTIGQRNSADFYNGEIDELRVSKGARSADWLLAEFINQNGASSFYNIDNGAEDPFDNSFWSNSIKVIVPATSVNGTVNDFPVYVKLDDFPDSFFSTVNGQGADIRVTQGDGISQVAFELVDIDTTANQGELWFKAPTLSNAADSEFLIWYGNATAEGYGEFSEFGSTQVWSNGFVAVYHFSDDPTTAILKDSTGNNFDGVASGVTASSDSVQGPVGKAYEWDGVNDGVNLGTDQRLNPKSFTWSGWFEPRGTASNQFLWSNARDCCGSYNGMDVRYFANANRYAVEIWNGTRPIFYSSNTGDNAADIYEETFLSFGLDNGTGAYHFVVNDRTDYDGTTAARVGQPASFETQIGQLGYSSNVYEANGLLDEIRLSNINRGVDWSNAEYKNQKTPGNFYIVENGGVAGFDPAFWSNSHKITIPASEVNGDLYNFPLFLNLKDLPTSFFAAAQADGADIRITENDQLTQVPFEIVSYDPINHEGEIWFKAINLSATSNNDFYIWAGNPSAQAYDEDHEFGQHEVWSEDFVAVYHLNEDPSTNKIYDSTRYSNDGNGFGTMTASNSVDRGNLSKAIEFDGTDDYFRIEDDDSLDLTTELHFSAWLKNYDSGTSQVFFSKDGPADTTGAYNVWKSTGISLENNNNNSAGYSNYDYDRWNFVSIDYEDGRVNETIAYKDGVFLASNADDLTPFSVLTTYAMIGRRGAPGSPFWYLGTADEVRLSREIRSANWVRTEYLNQNAPGNFYMVDNADHAGFDPSRWSNNHKITILADQVNGDLTEFPVYVNLGHLPSEFHSTVDPAGADIRMTENDGMTQVPFEIVELNTGTENGELWFKATNLSATTDTDFYLWYGNPTAQAYDRDDEFGSENVWTEGYIGVYHLNEDPTGTSNDSTKNKLHGSAVGTLLSTDLVSDGYLGKAVNFRGSSRYINIGNSQLLDITNNLTISTWLQGDIANTGYTGVVSKYAGGQGWDLILNIGSLQPRFDVRGASSIDHSNTLMGSSANNTWEYLSFTANSSIVMAYEDGSFTASQVGTWTATPATGVDAFIGQRGGTNSLIGKMDEVHIANKLRTANWISAEFINQNGAAQFYNIDNGIEDTFDPAFWSNSLKITIPASEINADLTEFPLYLNFKDLPASFFSVVDVNGDDIRMTQGDALTQIAHELVEIDTVNGEGELWFKAPTLSSSVDNYFYIYFGNNGAMAQPEAHPQGSWAVWSNGFEAVYHMNEDPSGTIVDSTQNQHDGSSIGSMLSSDLESGQLGKSINFDGTDDGLNFGNQINIANDQIHLSAWVNHNAPLASDIIINKEYSYEIGFNSGVYQAAIDTTAGGSWAWGGSLTRNLNEWEFVSFSHNNTAWEFFINDDRFETIAPTNSQTGNIDVNTNDTTVGSRTCCGGAHFDGNLDEVRIASKVRDQDWIFSEFHNQLAPGNFYLVDNGNDAGFSPSFWTNYEKITIPADELNGDLTDFPVYINLKDLPASFFSTVNGTGADIRVTNNGLFQVAFEIVNLDTNNGEGELWFKADSISATTDTDFYIWYGNPTAVAYDDDDEFGKYAVWDDFIAVYHFSDALVNGSASVLNSAQDAFHGTPLGGMVGSDRIKTIGGYAYDFEQDEAETIRLPEFGVSNFDNGTISFWYKQESTPAPASITMFFDLEGTGAGGHTINSADSNAIRTQIHDGSANQNTVNTNLINNIWQYASTHWSGTTGITSQRIDENLSSNSSRTYGVTNPFTDHYIASNRNSTRWFDGSMDEVRVSERVFDANWDLADYNNQLAPGNFYLVNNGNDAGFDPARWSNNHKITILADQVDSDLENFPVYVDLDHLPASFFATVDPVGADIRMTENDGLTQVPFEIVELDIAGENGELWFKADFLSSTTDTDFYLWYGNATAVAYDRDDEFGSENVWTEGYVGVWHMNEDPTGTILDSTSFQHDLSSAGSMTTTDLVNGSQLGRGIQFDGSDDYLSIASTTALNPVNINMSAWHRNDGPGTNGVRGIIASKSTNYIDRCISTYPLASFRIVTTQRTTGFSTACTALGEWLYLSASFDGTTRKINVDGVNEFSSSADTGDIGSTATPFNIGRFTSGSHYTNGIIDEVHWADRSRTDEWVFAEYINQKSAMDFYNIDNGIEDVFDPSLWSNSLKITVPASEVNADLSEFPVYLNFKDLPASFFTIVDANGADIRMTQGDALTQIAHELVEIDTVNGEGELWFKAPILSASVDNHFYIYYGNPITTAQPRNATFGSEAVWSQGYEAVYHFSDDPTTGTLTDSSANNFDGTSDEISTADKSVKSDLGKAFFFDGTNDSIDIGSDESLNPRELNISMWFESAIDPSTRHQTLLSNTRNCCGTYSGLDLRIENTNRRLNMLVWNGGVSTNTYSTVNSIRDLNNRFINIDFDSNNGNYTFFLEDQESNSGTSATVMGQPMSYSFDIGEMGFNNNTHEAEGYYDELRISSERRGLNWVATEYSNQEEPGNFYLVDNGNDAGFDDAFWSNSEKITILASEINGDLTDFPVYINFKDLPASFFGTVNGTGADIRITENDGMTQVAFELVSLDTNNGEGELWFKAPALSSSVDNEFFIWYGNPTAVAYDPDDEFGREAVWADYQAVFHLNEDPTGTIINSAGGNNANGSNMASSDLVQDGKLNSYYDLTSANNGLALNLNALFPTTLSAWIKFDSVPGDQAIFKSETALRGAFTLTSRYINYLNPANYKYATSPTYNIDEDDVNNWKLLNFEIVNGNAADSDIYQDGRDIGGNSAHTGSETAFNGLLFGYGWGANYFNGLVDEIRVSPVLRDQDWRMTEYASQDSPGNFYMINNGNDAGFEPSRWSNNHKITVLASEVNADLMNFPVYVDLSDIPSTFFSTVDATGADIRMTENDGITQIPFELVELDIVNGTGELWFKAPFLSSSTDTDFYLWYGNPTAVAYDRDDEFGLENVWTEGYRVVYHMNEDPTGSLIDSTRYNNSSSSVGSMTSTDLSNGQLGNAIDFDGTDDYINVASFVDDNYVNGSMSAWFNANASQNTNARFFEMGRTTSRVGTFINSGTIHGYGVSSGVQFDVTSDTTHNDASWKLSYINWQNNNVESFINDNQQAISDSSSAINLIAGDPLLIGQHVGLGSYQFRGILDEIRVNDQIRSEDWIEAEYINQEDGSEFYNIDNGVEDIGEGWVSSDWTNRLQITIAADQVNGTHTQFPVYLDLADLPSSFFSTVQADGEDIRITNSDGQTRLPFELVSIDTTLERGELHFRADNLTDAQDNIFYIYYSNSNARMPNGASELGAQAVWSNGYVAVYHMQEDPSPTGALIKDSTSYRNHGIPQGSMTAADLVNGAMGLALQFDGANDYILIPDDDSLSVGDGTTDQGLTLSSWFNRTGGTNAGIISKATSAAIGEYYILSNPSLYGRVVDNSASAYLGQAIGGVGGLQSVNVTYNASGVSTGISIYRNGLPLSTSDSSSGSYTVMENTSQDLYLGRRTFYFDGLIDEARIARKARSAEWIWTEFNNQNTPNTFYTISGTVEARTDTTGPKIERLIPKAKSITSPRRHPLRMIFDQIVNKATGFINIYQENGNIFEAIDISTGQVTGDGTDTLIITPSTYFTKAETYYVLIDPTAIRNASNEYYEGITNTETWKFTIQGSPRDEKPLYIFDGMI
jgi:hypothetical protein